MPRNVGIPFDVRFPWELPDAMPIAIHLWSQVELALFGSLSAPHGRAEWQERQISAVVDEILAADHPHARFRAWYADLAASGRLAPRERAFERL